MLLSAFFSACSGPGGTVLHSLPVPDVSSASNVIPRTVAELNVLATRVGRRQAMLLASRHYVKIKTKVAARAIEFPSSNRRRIQTMYAVTTCTTTYSNVSGVYDITTDPVVSQDCSVTYVDDGSSAGAEPGAPRGGTVDDCANADDPIACYAAKGKYPRYKNQDERNCEAANGRFMTVNQGMTRGGNPRSDVGTKCSKENNSPIFYPAPGDCADLLVSIWPDSIRVYHFSTDFTQTSPTSVGVRINSDCTTSWVPHSS